MSKLFSINLQSGRSDWLGDFTKPVLGIAFKANPVAYAASKDNKLINLQNGKAYKIADFNIEATSMAIGLRF